MPPQDYLAISPVHQKRQRSILPGLEAGENIRNSQYISVVRNAKLMDMTFDEVDLSCNDHTCNLTKKLSSGVYVVKNEVDRSA